MLDACQDRWSSVSLREHLPTIESAVTWLTELKDELKKRKPAQDAHAKKKDLSIGPGF